jgi:lysophospholipase L1-like esterase
MLPVRSSLLSSAGAGPSTSQGASGSGINRGRSSPQLQQQQQRRAASAERRETLVLAAVCAALLALSYFLGAQLSSKGSHSSSSPTSEAWRVRRARHEALAARDAETPPGLLRREREREEVLERLREGRCKGAVASDGQGGWRYEEEQEEEATTPEEQPTDDPEAARAARLAALAERLSQHPAAKGLNLSSAQQAELNHNGYEDPSAKSDDPDDAELRVLCVGDSLTMGLYQNSGKYRPYAIALERVLKDHLKGAEGSDDPQKHERDHRRGSEDRHEHGAPKKRLERKRHRAKSVHVVSSGIGGETVLGGMRDRMSGLLEAAEGRRREGKVGLGGGGGNATTTAEDGNDNNHQNRVDARRYDVVIILGGINDILRDKAEPEKLFKQGLARMYGRARRGHGAATLAVTLLDEGVPPEQSKQPDGQPDAQWKRTDINNRIRLEAAEAFARDLQSEEVRRMDGDWGDGGVGPLGLFDAAVEVPLWEKQREGEEANGEKRRTPWFDADALHLSYEGYERLGELMAKRIIEMGWI